MTQRSFNHFGKQLTDDSFILADSRLVSDWAGLARRVIPIPAVETAERLGAVKAANMVCVAAVAALTGVATLEQVQRAIEARTPSKFLSVNRAAAAQGWDFAQHLKAEGAA
jgi:Pyruvate/2-oxoacid:ferredoxin oxidoreductase gamma subunit